MTLSSLDYDSVRRPVLRTRRGHSASANHLCSAIGAAAGSLDSTLSDRAKGECAVAGLIGTFGLSGRRVMAGYMAAVKD